MRISPPALASNSRTTQRPPGIVWGRAVRHLIVFNSERYSGGHAAGSLSILTTMSLLIHRLHRGRYMDTTVEPRATRPFDFSASREEELPRKTEKPWGHELLWAWGPRYAAKILHIEAGQRLSLQYHQVKEETLLLVC